MGKMKNNLITFKRELIRKKILFLMILPTIVFFIVFAPLG